MSFHDFWTRWRREIVRGVAIFAVVLGAGLVVNAMVRAGKTRVENFALNFREDFRAADRKEAEPWVYAARLGAAQGLWIKNLRGDVTLERAAGDSVVVAAVRSYRQTDPTTVQLVANATAEGVVVCAIWPGTSDRCESGGGVAQKGDAGRNDVAVHFTVQLPKGVRVNLTTVSGDIDATELASPLEAMTVNGDVDVQTSAGPVKITTVNGNVTARLSGAAANAGADINTVHGDAVIELPDEAAVTVSGASVTGDISTDFPLTVSGKFASHEVQGLIGRGGSLVKLKTVAGDIRIVRSGLPLPAQPDRPGVPSAPKAPAAAVRPGQGTF